METAWRLILLCILGFSFSFSEAASFDCTAATKRVEKLICDGGSYLDVGRLDERMADIYARLLAQSSSQTAANARTAQRAWIVNVRDKCSDVSCLWDAYKERIWQLAEQLEDFDCADYAETTVEMDSCGKSKLDELDKKMDVTFQALVKRLETPDCCDSRDHGYARQLAVEAQEHWKRFREAECKGHYATISNGTLRGSFYLSCATALTTERIKQLSQWGTVDLGHSAKFERPRKNPPQQ